MTSLDESWISTWRESPLDESWLGWVTTWWVMTWWVITWLSHHLPMAWLCLYLTNTPNESASATSLEFQLVILLVELYRKAGNVLVTRFCSHGQAGLLMDRREVKRRVFIAWWREQKWGSVYHMERIQDTGNGKGEFVLDRSLMIGWRAWMKHFWCPDSVLYFHFRVCACVSMCAERELQNRPIDIGSYFGLKDPTEKTTTHF